MAKPTNHSYPSKTYRGLEPERLQGINDSVKIWHSDKITVENNPEFTCYTSEDLSQMRPSEVRKIVRTLKKYSFKFAVGNYFRQVTNEEPLNSLRIEFRDSGAHIVGNSNYGDFDLFFVEIFVHPQPYKGWSFVNLQNPDDVITDLVEPVKIDTKRLIQAMRMISVKN